MGKTLAQLDNLILDAVISGKPKCGDCSKWLNRKECPREHGIHTGGPSMNDASCGQFAAPTSQERKAND